MVPTTNDVEGVTSQRPATSSNPYPPPTGQGLPPGSHASTPPPTASASQVGLTTTQHTSTVPEVISTLPSASYNTGGENVLMVGIGVFALAVITIVVTAGYRGPRRH